MAQSPDLFTIFSDESPFPKALGRVDTDLTGRAGDGVDGSVAVAGCWCCHVNLSLACVQFFAANARFTCHRIGIAKRPLPLEKFFRPSGNLAIWLGLSRRWCGKYNGNWDVGGEEMVAKSAPICRRPGRCGGGLWVWSWINRLQASGLLVSCVHHPPAPSPKHPEDRTGFEAGRDVEKDGKRIRKDGKRMEKDGKRMRKGAKRAITYSYSMDIEQDFAKLDSDPARTRQLQVRHEGKR